MIEYKLILELGLNLDFFNCLSNQKRKKELTETGMYWFAFDEYFTSRKKDKKEFCEKYYHLKKEILDQLNKGEKIIEEPIRLGLKLFLLNEYSRRTDFYCFKKEYLQY